MIFRRTAAGINNLHLFFTVDKVVYCEGGKSIDVAAIMRGEGEDATLDIMFWSSVRSFIGGTKTCHFKSVGSRAVLESLENDILAGSVKTIIICRDSDYDDVLGKKKNHPFLLHTYGYSWENDAVRPQVLLSVFQSYLPADDSTDKISMSLKKALEKLNKHLKRWCEVDITLVAKGTGALFVRSSPLQLFDDTNISPKTNAKRVAGRLGTLGMRKTPKITHKLPDDDTLRYACGKVVSSLSYKLTTGHAVKRDASLKVSLDMFLRNCISATFDHVARGECREIQTHYEKFRGAFD